MNVAEPVDDEVEDEDFIIAPAVKMEASVKTEQGPIKDEKPVIKAETTGVGEDDDDYDYGKLSGLTIGGAKLTSTQEKRTKMRT